MEKIAAIPRAAENEIEEFRRMDIFGFRSCTNLVFSLEMEKCKFVSSSSQNLDFGGDSTPRGSRPE